MCKHKLLFSVYGYRFQNGWDCKGTARFLYFRVSNRGESALLAHDFPLESLVCYTFCDPGWLKGVVRWGNKHFEIPTEQADFASLRDGK